VAIRLPSQSIGELNSNGSILDTDQQVNMSNFIAIASLGFTNVHRHGRSPQSFSMSATTAVAGTAGKRQKVSNRRPDANSPDDEP